MRRKDREITEKEELAQIIGACRVARIAMAEDNRPYVVPMNFGTEWQGETLVLYFHCAKEGKKIDILKKNPGVCFEMDCGHELLAGDFACEYGFCYASVIGFGEAEFLEGREQKEHALLKIMEHQTGGREFRFDEKAVNAVTAFRVVSTRYSGKKRPSPV